MPQVSGGAGGSKKKKNPKKVVIQGVRQQGGTTGEGRGVIRNLEGTTSYLTHKQQLSRLASASAHEHIPIRRASSIQRAAKQVAKNARKKGK